MYIYFFHIFIQIYVCMYMYYIFNTYIYRCDGGRPDEVAKGDVRGDEEARGGDVRGEAVFALLEDNWDPLFLFHLHSGNATLHVSWKGRQVSNLSVGNVHYLLPAQPTGGLYNYALSNLVAPCRISPRQGTPEYLRMLVYLVIHDSG